MENEEVEEEEVVEVGEEKEDEEEEETRPPPLLLVCPKQPVKRTWTENPLGEAERGQSGAVSCPRPAKSRSLPPPTTAPTDSTHSTPPTIPSPPSTSYVKEPDTSVHRQSSFNPEEHYELINVSKKKWKNGPVCETRYRVAIKGELETACQLTRQQQLLDTLEAAFRKILQAVPPTDTAQVFLTNDRLHKQTISTRRGWARDLRFEDLTDSLCAALNSDASIDIGDTIFILSTFTRNPVC